MRRRAFVLVLLIVCVVAHTPPAGGGIAAKPSPFDALARLEGAWVGTVEGEPGHGTVERRFTRVLGGRFVEILNASTYPPQEHNKEGERHEDHGFLSFDRSRRRFVLRQFHVEGFVNQYVADSIGTVPPDSIVFRSEAIENIPPGFRAKETWRFVSPDEMVERFEMAEPGADFTVYSRTTLRRTP